MDSIERMRRINDLTRELKQHGFAESSFEAIKQANQIYGSDDLDDNVKDGIIKSSPHDKMTKDDTMSDDDKAYETRKLAKVAEAVDVLTNKMNEMIRAINDLDARIGEVKAKQDKIIATRQEPVRSESRVEPRTETRSESNPELRASPNVDEPKHEQKSEAPAQHKDEYSMNQRTGNFQSQDVAIDKMFYFGKK